MTGRIQELRNKLQPLAAREAELHLESHRVCHFEPGPNNTPKYIVSDEKRFAAIGKELEVIQGERAKILDKVSRLEGLLGPGAQNIPSGYSDVDYVARLKMELTTFFIHKIIEPGNGDRHYTRPEDAINDPRYIAKRAEIMPQIEASEAKMERERELAAAAAEILAEP